MSKRAVALSTLLAAAAGLAFPALASATYPGQNGKLIYAVAEYNKRAKDNFFLGQGTLFTISPDGSGSTELPDDPAYNDYEPAWSPDGTLIAVGAVAGGKSDGIYVGEPTSPKPRLISKTENADTPTWSPDGKTVTYLDYVKGILSVPSDGSTRPRLIAKHPRGWLVTGPSYTPDGATIVFARLKMGGSPAKFRSELWAMDATGANPRRILAQTDNLLFPSAPDVSPDGTKIVFEAATSEGVPALWIAGIDGSATRVLATAARATLVTAPTWSPDGTKIAASILKSTVKKGSALVTFDALTGTMTTLTSLKKAYLMSPSWQSIPAPVAAPASR